MLKVASDRLEGAPAARRGIVAWAGARAGSVALAALLSLAGSLGAIAQAQAGAAPTASARDAREAREARRARQAEAAPAPAADPIVEAREALRRRDRARLAALLESTRASGHPLASWVDYWELSLRLKEATVADLEAFYARWPGTYVEDRLRNDWLLELGRRRDWPAFSADFPRFRMNDDREVTCYALLTEHLAGRNVKAAALAAWLAQREADDGCQLMARTLVEARQFGSDEVWRKVRFSVDAGRPRAARAAAGLLSPGLDASVAEVYEQPLRWLQRRSATEGRVADELATLALMRQATVDHAAAVRQLEDFWDAQLGDDLRAWAWAMNAKWAAIRLQDDASDLFARAARHTRQAGLELDWPDDTLAWKVRAALRAGGGAGRWQQVVQGIDAMSPAEQRDAAWVYWKARALQRLAGTGDAEGLKAQSRQMLAGIASPLSFYGQLALDALGQPPLLPVRPAAPSAEERDAALAHAGLSRALRLIELGLRSEGVREWNFSLRGMDDRALLAAAQRACDREVWDRCINTSERTRSEIDLVQRFPTPMRREVLAAAREGGVDPAFVYGLIRQESRFIMDARSVVGASGLMQLMPATARWTARKIGLDYTPDLINDRDTNLKLGTAYLKLVLDDFGGAQPLAAAAYNAGPGRPRRWREGPVLDAAVWTENIPINETRDYVKKVLANAALYSAILAGVPPVARAAPSPNPSLIPSANPSPAPAAGAQAAPAVAPASVAGTAPVMATGIPVPESLREATSVRQRLGRSIGPRENAAGEPDRSLP